MIEQVRAGNGGNVVYCAKLHWIIFCLPVLFLGLSLCLGIYIEALRIVSYVLSVCGLLWVFMVWLTYYFSSLCIQKKHVILQTGILIRQTIDIPIGKIESIDIRQSIAGSLFQYGTLIITGTGGSRQFVNFLQKPLTCRRYIEQLMNEQ